MNEKYKPLFTPWKVGNLEIKNRIVQTSMGGTSLFGWFEPCHFDKEAANFLLERAKNNVGLILPGMQWVRDPLGNRWLYTNDRMFKELKEWMVEFHKTGAKLFIQLAAGNGRAMGLNHLMVKLLENKALGFLGKPIMDPSYLSAAPSPLPNRWAEEFTSREMTREEIHEIVEAFGKTAKKLRDAGVDGVEIHAVHEGYVLDQFTFKNMNHRTDEYGGSFENRYRFAVEIVQCIHRYAGDDFPVSLRYSVVSKTKDFMKGALPGEEFVEFGRDMEESERAIKYLEEAGYALFNCDNGNYDAWYWAHPPQYMPDNCNLEDVEHIKKFTNAPVICAGRMDMIKAAEEIAAGRLDAVGVARQNLVDPQWINKILEGRENEIKPCIRCHNGCFNMSKYKGSINVQPQDDSLHMARCALTPPTMQHKRYKIVPTNNPKKVAIVGGGIGGMECALVLKKRGHNPVIFEKTDKLGGLFITASSMSFKENDKQLIEWYLRELKEHEIEVHFNTEISSLDSLKKSFDEIIVATGAVPRQLQAVPGFDKTVNFTELLVDKKDVGDKVLFIGGGQSSCEAAYELALQGKHPIVVEMANDLIVSDVTCLANTSFLREALPYHNVPVYLESTVTAIRDGSVTIKNIKSGETFDVECDAVVNGAGFVPAPIGEKSKNVHRVGDCVAVGNLRTVIWRAWDICMKL